MTPSVLKKDYSEAALLLLSFPLASASIHSMEQQTLRHHLRIGTREVHEALHASRGFYALSEATITPHAFQTLMSGMGQFYQALDGPMIQACARHKGKIGGYQYRPRAKLFAVQQAKSIVLPGINGPAALAGAAYVVDGAVLGGKILGSGPLTFARHPYWDWCARDGSKIWRSACALLDHLDRDGINHAEVLSSATAVFEAFGKAMADHMDQIPA